MPTRPLVTRRDWLTAGAAGLGAAALPPAAAAGGPAAGEYAFHHDHVIGTSLDLSVAAPNAATAAAAERALLGEVERLRRVLSVYDPASEVSRVNRARGPVPVSPDLAAVLRVYDHWRGATGGVVGGQLGALTRLWKDAEASGELPQAAALDRIARGLLSPGWSLDAADTVTRTADRPLDLNALGKAYILDRAVEAARRAAPAATGLLLNLGGDVVAWGSAPDGTGWAVGVQDPLDHYDNAAPLAGLRLTNRAVAGSGGYQRFYTVGGRRYSHVLDPRTGWPAEGVAGAAVVAADAVTANALATALCVLTPAEGLCLVAGVAGAGCLIVAADGARFRSPGLELLEVTPARVTVPVAARPAADGAWPEGYQVTVAVELPKVEARRYRRPYVAVWAEDEKGRAVRTLGVWGNAPKYLKDLTDWWKVGRGDGTLVRAVARATRGPGKYELVWDGKDDKGNVLPPGTYTMRVEVHREFGGHLRQSGKIECRDKPAGVKLEKNAETGETVVEYKKPEKK